MNPRELAGQSAERLLKARTPWGRGWLNAAARCKRAGWLVVVNAAFLAKRALDIGISAVALLLLGPVMLLIAALVRLDGGPVFFRQVRVGLNGREFRMLKFRSMCVDAEARLAEVLARNEKASGVTFKLKNDPRITRVGRWLRKSSLDELPQFWNVLTGEMSLVGPRPERPELIENFKEDIPHYNVRHNIKPGVTGWAQVNGLRGDTCLRERVKFDLDYIENWNVMLDLQIMLMTFFSRKGAC